MKAYVVHRVTDVRTKVDTFQVWRLRLTLEDALRLMLTGAKPDVTPQNTDKLVGIYANGERAEAAILADAEAAQGD